MKRPRVAYFQQPSPTRIWANAPPAAWSLRSPRPSCSNGPHTPGAYCRCGCAQFTVFLWMGQQLSMTMFDRMFRQSPCGRRASARRGRDRRDLSGELGGLRVRRPDVTQRPHRTGATQSRGSDGDGCRVSGTQGAGASATERAKIEAEIAVRQAREFLIRRGS